MTTSAPDSTPADSGGTSVDQGTGEPPTMEEFAESLTGYDEIAIAKYFGAEVGDLPGTRFVRAMAFVGNRRQGLTDRDAYEAVMSATLKQVTEAFADDPDDALPDEPDSPAGKGA